VLLEKGASLMGRLDVDPSPASLVKEIGVIAMAGMAGADVHVPSHIIAEDAVQQDVLLVLRIGHPRDHP
jgi:hypothetical protein